MLEYLHHDYLMFQLPIEQVSSNLTYLSQFHKTPLSKSDRASTVVKQFLSYLVTLNPFRSLYLICSSVFYSTK
jgi:hypothetical protein